MLIPRYWSRAESQATTPDGRPVRFHVWRGSRTSPAEAQALANEAVVRIADRIQRGQGFPERYAYGDRPLREEVVREIPGAAPAADTPDAALTRNSYGALVLNAARAFFIDVDVPAADASPSSSSRASAAPGDNPLNAVFDAVESLPLPGALKSIFGSFRSMAAPPPAPAPAAPPPPPADPQTAAIDRLRQWVAQHPEWRVRVYRTHSGLRYLVTHAPFSPTDPDAQAAMQALGADPQYVTLCAVQKSFRARLTPKPWRIGMDNPPVTFPYESPMEEGRMRQWEVQYQNASRGRATAQFVEEMGGGSEHPGITPIRALHDEQTRATSGLPLA
ncbi:hypothetical protein [Longimicrobium sp.]|uniref:hypothetical protein n=1 Tax=Longimicrobium sp. TaxID=2029185 RepID=UPI002E341006|nr:hypothetical protein [Longimicrobium sp.]HEX6036643.1 hypothetical protein [Longimicrobium sp.]